MLHQLKDSVEAIKEIFELLIGLGAIVRKHPWFFLSLCAVTVSYSLAFWYANYWPANTIDRYYASLGARKHDEAWELLSDAYKSPRWKSPEAFASSYSTSVPHENLQISAKNPSYSLIPNLFARSLRFEAAYELTERFTKEDLKHPQQRINSLWLQIHHRRDYPSLISGSLKPLDGINPSLALRRYYKTTVILTRGSVVQFPSSWEIQYMNFTEQGLKPIQGFQ